MSVMGLLRRSPWAWLMSLPQDMIDGGSPTPRNESVASATIAAASPMVVTTITGAIELGSTWRLRMVNLDTPSATAEVTKSEFLTERIWPLSTRAVLGQAKNPMASEITQMFRCSRSTDMMTTAARMYGIAKKMSPIRDRTASI